MKSAGNVSSSAIAGFARKDWPKAREPMEAASSRRRDNVMSVQRPRLVSSPPPLAALARGNTRGFRHRPACGFYRALARRHGARRLKPHAPIFPRPDDDVALQAERAGKLDFTAIERLRRAKRERAQLIVGVLAHENRS